MSRSLGTQMADMGVDKAMFRHLPGAIRTAVANAGKPVAILAVCKYRDLAEADAMIGSGAADMIGMARAHIADPMIVAKWQAGREDEVRPCIGCNQGCAQNLERNLPITCFVNPMAGREGDWRESDADPAPKSRRVVVVGGGPAGIEAAAVAASRGHRVTLLERGAWLGGRLRLAAGLRLREDFGNWLEFSERRLARLGVDMHLQHDATARSVRSYDPDAVILATGAEPVAFTLADGSHALTLDQAAQTDFSGACVVVYDETGDWGAMGLVEHLAEQGAKVTLATPVAGVLWRTTVYSSTTTLARWREKRIRIKTLRRPSGFSPRQRELVLEDVSTGEPEIIAEVDALVACVPPRARHALEQPLIAAGIRPVLVGDCLAPRNALEAIFEGHRAARAF